MLVNRLWRQIHNVKPVRDRRIFSRPGSVKSWVPNFKFKTVKLILTAGRVIEKIIKENKNRVVTYINPIFRFETQTFNGGYKSFTLFYRSQAPLSITLLFLDHISQVSYKYQETFKVLGKTFLFILPLLIKIKNVLGVWVLQFQTIRYFLSYIRTLMTVVLHFLFKINTVHFSLRCSRPTH